MHDYHDRPRTAALALDRPSPAFRPLLAAVALLAAALAAVWLTGSAFAAPDVTPVLIEGNGNFTCAQLQGQGQSWTELKVDPNQNGTYTDGTLTVVVSNTTNDKTFNWASNIGVDAVFVKAGAVGHYLYVYDPPSESTADDGLTSPGGGSTNQISHIAFCYDLGGSTPTPTVAAATSTPPAPVTASPAPVTASPVPVTASPFPASPTPQPSASPSPTALAAVALPNTGESSGNGGALGAAVIAGLAMLAVALLAYSAASRPAKP